MRLTPKQRKAMTLIELLVVISIVGVLVALTMLVAAFSAHWQNGWQAIADKGAVFASDKLGPLAFENADGAVERLDRARSILQEHGNYEWLTENGSFVVLNNGIEFAATYFVMLLVLFFYGPGKASIDHLVSKRFGNCGN